jgi:hypothetical protein
MPGVTARSLLLSPETAIGTLWIASLRAGTPVFRDFGLAWDELLFYRCTDALGYACSVPEGLSGSCDLTQAFGPSAEDQTIYGSAYLLDARKVTGALRTVSGLPAREVWQPSSWTSSARRCALGGVVRGAHNAPAAGALGRGFALVARSRESLHSRTTCSEPTRLSVGRTSFWGLRPRPSSAPSGGDDTLTRPVLSRSGSSPSSRLSPAGLRQASQAAAFDRRSASWLSPPSC